MWYTGISELRLLVDPCVLKCENFNAVVNEFVGLKMMIMYLQGITKSGVSLSLFYPEYLLDRDWKNGYIAILPEESTILEKEPDGLDQKESEIVKCLTAKKTEYEKYIKKYSPEELLEIIKSGEIDALRDASYLHNGFGLKIADLAEKLRCHYFVTSNRFILREKEKIEQTSGLIVISLYEMQKEVELFLIGNNIFISRFDHAMGYDVSTFYPMTDQKFRRYEMLWSKLITIKNDQRASNYFRIALYHRYCFMLFAKDQIDFHMRQLSLIKKYIDRSPHRHLASYHLNAFYIMLWGLLDNLAWAFNFLYNFGYDDSKYKDRTHCTFSNKAYKNKLNQHAPALYQFITNSDTEKWLKDLTIKRHPVAHREPIYLSQLVRQGDMSVISDTMHTTMGDGGRVFFDAINHFHHDFEQCINFLDSLCDVYGVKK